METIDCRKCQAHMHFRCNLCDKNSSESPARKFLPAPVCKKCKIRYEKTVDDLKSKLAELQNRVCPALAFLKLDNLDRSKEIFKGDVAFVVHGCDDIHAHRFILAGRSPVFRSMFHCGMLGKETGLIPIDDASYPVMRAVIDYCYTADINFTDEVPPDEVLKVAHKYDIGHLKHVCEEELCGRISEGNLAEMLRLSRRYEAKTLQKVSVKYFKEHFDAVISAVLELGL